MAEPPLEKPMTTTLDPTLAIAPATALKAVERVTERWHLRRQDLPALLGSKPRTVRSWYENTPSALDQDVLERIGHLVGIYDALHTIFGDSDYADRWIHEPNLAFGEKKPADLMLSGSFTALVDVHRYLQHAFA
jgi:uncharacterized protein (DUF2384 family)